MKLFVSFLLASLVSTSALAEAASAGPPSGLATKTWVGGVSDSWHTAGNWTPSGVPGAGDDVVIANTGVGALISSAAVTVASLRIDSGATCQLDNGFDLAVTGLLDVRGTLSSTLAASDVLGSGDFSMTSTGNWQLSTGDLLLDGDGTMTVPASATAPIVEVTGGTRRSGNATLAGLRISGGTLKINDFGTLKVVGDALLSGGTLDFDTTIANFDTLDIDGNLFQTGTSIGTTTTQSRIYCSGNWAADTAFTMANGWVYLDGGDTTIGGLAPAFHRVQFTSGKKTLNSDVTIDGQLKTVTTSTDGPGWLEFTGSIAPHEGNNDFLHQVRFPSGTAQIKTSILGELEITGGTMALADAATITVTGDARLIGGTLNFDTTIANFDTLDVAGDLIQTATAMGTTSAQSRIYVEGDWMADTTFTMTNGWVYLDGADSSIGGLAPAFHRVWFTSGKNTLLVDVPIDGQLKTTTGTTDGPGWLEFEGSVTPHEGNNDLLHQVRITSGTNQFRNSIFGVLEVTGGTLHLIDNTTLTVNTDARLIGGTLSFDTTVGNPDTLDVAGDLIQTGTAIGSTSATTRIYVTGDWLADTPFVLAEGWVYLEGPGANIGGAAPAFKRLNLLAGVRTLLTTTDISGSIVSGGGSSAGSEWFELTDSVQAISSGVNPIHKLRVVAGAISFANTQLGEFELTGGSILIPDNVTLKVSGNFSLLGGTLDFDTTVANPDTIDIEGDFFQNGAFLGTASDFLRIFCAGNWRSDTGFTLLQGWVYLDGAADTTIDGIDPALNNLRVTGGKRSVLAGLHVRGNLDVETNATLELLTDMELGGDLDTTASGASIIGAQTIDMTGTGFLKTNSTPIPHCLLTTGLRNAYACTLESLTLAGGELHMQDNSNLHVLGDVVLGAGVLSFDTTVGNKDRINIDGNLSQSAATLGTTSVQSEIRVAGDWAAATAFVMDQGWVILDGGDATIGGPAPTFGRLHLESGVKTVGTDTLVSGTILSTGGSTDGAAYLVCTDNVQPISTGTNPIARLRVQSGLIPFANSRVGELELTGGELHVQDNVTVTVDGDARLLGGTLSFNTTVGNLDTLDVNGHLIESGTLAGTTSNFTRLKVAGNWTGNGTLVLPSGRVELDGPTPTSIGGADPTFGNLWTSLSTRSLLADVDVTGDLELTSASQVDVAAASLDVAGDLTATATGVSIVGTGPVLLSGDGVIRTNALGVPPVEITGGKRDSANATVASLTLSAGELHLLDNSNLDVLGDATFDAGVLSFNTTVGNPENLDIEGDLIQVAATIGSTSTASHVYVGGDWSADGPFGLPNGWVHLDGGDATIGGLAPEFKRLDLDSGVMTVNSATEVTGTILSSGGSTAGPEWLFLTGNVQAIQTGANELGRLRVQAGVIPFKTSRIGEFEITGGELRILDNVTLTVADDAKLIGGMLSFDATIGNLDRLTVEGSVEHLATTSGTSSSFSRFTCKGDWHSNATFAMASGIVELSGAATTELGGSIPGLDPVFPTLLIKGGERRVVTDTLLTAALVDIDTDGRLSVAGDALRPLGTPIGVDGTLAVEAGGRLLPDASSSILVNPAGRLELLGTASSPAVLEGLGSGFDCVVNGQLAARHFEVRSPGPSGLVVSGSLGAAPDDLRDGLFSHPSSVLGSSLLTLDSGAAVLPFLRFEDPLAVGTYNVSRSAGTTVTLVNTLGGFEGAAFENDPGGKLDWSSVTTSVIAGFKAKPGAEQVSLSWTSTAEAAGLTTWRLQSAPTASGPFGLVVDLVASGPSAYAFVDSPLTAGETRHYRLLEVQSGGLVNLLGSDSATPWSSALPANVATVGPSGDFATIQEAIDAASGPAAVIQVAAGSYPGFSILAPVAGQIHVMPDGSGPVLVDATSAPIEIAFAGFGQVVELVGLDIQGGTFASAVHVHDNLAAVLFDELTITGGAGSPGLVTLASLAVSVARCDLTGTPGLDVGAASEVYIGRGSLDQLDVAAGGAVQLAGLTPGATNALPGSDVVSHAGVMPDVQCGSFQSLGVPFGLDFAGQPGVFYQLATASSLIPIDLGDPAFWQMLLLVNFGNYVVVDQGFTDGVTGLVAKTVELPADASFLGAVLPVQGWTIAVSPAVEVRFSNVRMVVAMP